jgi:hypothetical protein
MTKTIPDHPPKNVQIKGVNYFRRAVNALYTANRVNILGMVAFDPVIDSDTGDATVRVEAPDTITLLDTSAESLKFDDDGNPVTYSVNSQRRLINSMVDITLPFYGAANSMRPRIARGNTVLFMGYYASQDTNSGKIMADKYHNMDASMQRYVAKNTKGHPSLTNNTYGHHSSNEHEFVGFVRSIRDFESDNPGSGYGMIITINYTTHRVLPINTDTQPEYFDSETELHEAHLYLHANVGIPGFQPGEISRGDIISSKTILKTNAHNYIVGEAKSIQVIRKGARNIL